MGILDFFDSYPGMYVTQSFCHSLIAALVVDASLVAWRISDPVVRQRFRLIVILFPIVSFPLYQAINPERDSISFRLRALFDTNRWLNLEVWGVPAGLLFIFFLFFTAFIFFFQEMVPIVRHTLSSNNIGSAGERPPGDSPAGTAYRTLPDPKPDVFLIDDEEVMLFSTTGSRPAIFLSSGFVEGLTVEQLRTALAHEIGHIQRSRRPILVAVFLLRILMFFNPVALMEFRRIVQEEEKICDDIAVSQTGNPQALAEALRKFYYTDDDANPVGVKETPRLRDRLEEYSHTMLIESRISRLEQGPVQKTEGWVFVFILTLAAILVINYSVV